MRDLESDDFHAALAEPIEAAVSIMQSWSAKRWRACESAWPKG
jgi:hypothetical protein